MLLPYPGIPPAVGVDFFEGPYQDADGIDNAIGIGFNEAVRGNGIGYGDGIADNERFGMRSFLYMNRAEQDWVHLQQIQILELIITTTLEEYG